VARPYKGVLAGWRTCPTRLNADLTGKHSGNTFSLQSPNDFTKKEETMIRTFVTAAIAVMISILVVSLSHAGASCCDPANTARVPQTAGPTAVGARQATATAVPNNGGWRGMAAFMGYGQPEGVRLSDLAPSGSCCSNPNTSCASRPNAAGQKPVQGLAQGCSAGCCGGINSGLQPTRGIQQSGVRPIQAAGPASRVTAPVSELGAPLTASPVKAQARPRTTVSGSLW
jgi:hypothetical protein